MGCRLWSGRNPGGGGESPTLVPTGAFGLSRRGEVVGFLAGEGLLGVWPTSSDFCRSSWSGALRRTSTGYRTGGGARRGGRYPCYCWLLVVGGRARVCARGALSLCSCWPSTFILTTPAAPTCAIDDAISRGDEHPRRGWERRRPVQPPGGSRWQRPGLTLLRDLASLPAARPAESTPI